MTEDSIYTSITSVFAKLDEFTLTRDPFTIDLPQFWQHAKEKFPIVDAIQREVLSIPPTSLSVERLFSYAGKIISTRRLRLSEQQRIHGELCAANSAYFKDFYRAIGTIRPKREHAPWEAASLPPRFVL